jgi:hypothetical protein
MERSSWNDRHGTIVMERRDALCHEQWERLEALGLPGHSGHVGVTAKDNRRFVEAVL